MITTQERFRALFDEQYRNILGYALRRVPDAADAADVANETFAIAWRRINDLPTEPETKLWLYGTARMVIRNHQRSTRRRTRLSERLGNALKSQLPPEESSLTTTRRDIEAAMQSLNATDREIVQLTVWEEFTPREIAALLAIEPGRVRKRLFHARKQLEQKLTDGHVDATPSIVENETRSKS